MCVLLHVCTLYSMYSVHVCSVAIIIITDIYQHFVIYRMQEDELSAASRAEMDSLICQHKHQTQLIINEFNRAKEILTRKLNETEKRYEIL